MKKQPKYRIIKFENPITKSYQEVEKYEVARFEFGDFDNWVNAIILDISVERKIYSNNALLFAKIKFCGINGDEQVCYDTICDGKLDFEIIGKAETIESQNTNDDSMEK